MNASSKRCSLVKYTRCQVIIKLQNNQVLLNTYLKHTQWRQVAVEMHSSRFTPETACTSIGQDAWVYRDRQDKPEVTAGIHTSKRFQEGSQVASLRCAAVLAVLSNLDEHDRDAAGSGDIPSHGGAVAGNKAQHLGDIELKATTVVP
jgi:hypothetical protein